ncbi:BQ5605_C065g12805 [Microbotryum silenes-dioicae]|uniref:BQ5605_C065g12805 protein n=1 Tax=Microbotryum silenes-dioicae TaxID=796604 RepID=A0A2X0MRJ4_9BASI|nr:BQ5605_C065g12805 [Microbotryum silenes-dioicae]
MGCSTSFFARGSQESVPCGIWQLPIYTVDFSSARAIDRAPRFDGFRLVPPFRVEKVDFSSARAIDRAPQFDGFAKKVDFSSARAINLEKVDFSSAQAIDRALSIFIFTGNLGFYSKTYPGIGLYPTYDTLKVCPVWVEFLGMDCQFGTIRMSQAHKDVILIIAKPTTKVQLQHFLGSVEWSSCYFPHLAKIVAPLTNLVGDAPWTWSAAQDIAFEETRRRLMVLSGCQRGFRTWE